MSTKLYWHFLPDDKRLANEDNRLVRVGKTIKVKGDPVLCHHGLHASRRAIDALGYAPGPIVCRVALGGTVLHDDDKSVGTERTVLWMADATETLHEFACRCAEDALKAANVTDQRCWRAIETKRKWLRGEATDDELAAAGASARDAAWAAWAAASDAASDAAWAARAAARAAAWAASDAACDAASDAACDAAWDAARDAQNRRLTAMLSSLKPKGTT